MAGLCHRGSISNGVLDIVKLKECFDFDGALVSLRDGWNSGSFEVDTNSILVQYRLSVGRGDGHTLVDSLELSKQEADSAIRSLDLIVSVCWKERLPVLAGKGLTSKKHIPP